MSNDQREAVIPVDQALVPFYGSEIVAVRLADGRIAAVFSALCDAVQLERKSQTDRIHEDEILSEQLLLVQIETPGGPQAVNVLTAWAIPTWLQGVRLSRVAPEKRPAILAFKREAADALYRHFSRHPALPAPEAVVPSEPIPTPTAPAADAPREVWRTYYRDMLARLDWQDMVERRQDEVERWQGVTEAHLRDHETHLHDHEERLRDHDQQIGELHSRVEGNEELSRMLAEALTRLGPQPLTPAHQATIKHQATRLHELSGFAYATIYGELNAAFHVGRYDDIADARWPEIAAWFKTRLDAAEQRG